MVLFDGAPQYEAIAKSRGISFKVLIAGRRNRQMPKAYHLNSVNSLHAQWKDDFRPRWRDQRQSIWMATRAGWWRAVAPTRSRFFEQSLPDQRDTSTIC